jgi:hypothetical protein
MSKTVNEPWDNGICKKCQHFIEDRYCEAYTFASHLAYCEFVSCCEMFEEGEHHD